MKLVNITAQVKDGDGVVTYPRFAEVVLTLDTGEEVTFVIHQSRCYTDTINVEVDGNFVDDNPALRINLNDTLVLDTVEEVEGLPDSRKPDLDDEEPDDGELVPSTYFESADRKLGYSS